MIEVSTHPEILAGGDEIRRSLQTFVRAAPKKSAGIVRLASDWSAAARQSDAPLLVVFHAKMVDDAKWLKQVRSLSRPKVFLMVAGSIPCQGIPERMAKLNVRDPDRIHVSGVQGEQEEQLFARLIVTLASEECEERILDAWLEGDTFVVMNPRFRRLHVPLSRIRVFGASSVEDLEHFEIDDDGLFVYWPRLDVHLGWEQFAQATDAFEYTRARQQSKDFNKHYGAAIRALRESRRLKQSDIPGLTPRQVGRIERGECRATSSALAKLAAAHNLSASDYMAALAERLDENGGDR